MSPNDPRQNSTISWSRRAGDPEISFKVIGWSEALEIGNSYDLDVFSEAEARQDAAAFCIDGQPHLGGRVHDHYDIARITVRPASQRSAGEPRAVLEIITAPGEYISQVAPEIRAHGSFSAAAIGADHNAEVTDPEGQLETFLKRIERVRDQTLTTAS
jgi:hypothetical protein